MFSLWMMRLLALPRLRRGLNMTYEIIARNYARGLWTKMMVRIAVRKGVLTKEQYKMLTGEEY